MIEFRKGLQDHLEETLLPAWVGAGTDPTDYIHTFDDHLHDFDLDITPDPFPFLVVNVRTAEVSGQSEPEIGNPHDLYEWAVHIYYVDTVTDYDVGEDRRDKIIGKIVKNVEENRRLNNFEVVDGTGKREYVWETRISSALFDSSGQDEYYTFVTELYLTVDTARG